MGTFLHLQLVGGNAHSAFLSSVFLRGLTMPGIARTLQVTVFPRRWCNSGASKASFFYKSSAKLKLCHTLLAVLPQNGDLRTGSATSDAQTFQSTTQKSEHLRLSVTF